MIIESLDWDSHFFGIKIGKVQLSNNSLANLNAMTDRAKQENYRLLYLIAAETDTTPAGTIAVEVDVKTTYQVPTMAITLDVPITQYASTAPTPELLELGIASGVYSRFYTDKNFPAGSFERMYEIWIEKSLNKQMADYFFVYTVEDTIVGFVSVKLETDKGIMCLMAVNETYRGRGIGKAFVQYVQNFLHNKGIPLCSLDTQGHNTEAIKLYDRMGFKRTAALHYYHLWL